MYTLQINPIAIQSQNMITDAFFELLSQQSYDSITVTALCEKAKVGRKTFYRNFETMNDIIMYRVDHLVKDYVENQPNLNNRKQLLIYFFNTCKHAIRTLPLLQFSESIPEDLDTSQEDHFADSFRYFCMSRPITPKRTTQKSIPLDDPLNLYEKYSYK